MVVSLYPSISSIGEEDDLLEVRLHKLVVYEEGGFFLPHRDTPHVTTPGGRKRRVGVNSFLSIIFVPHPVNTTASHCLFYHDVEHCVSDIEKGRRLVLTFDVRREHRPSTPDHTITTLSTPLPLQSPPPLSTSQPPPLPLPPSPSSSLLLPSVETTHVSSSSPPTPTLTLTSLNRPSHVSKREWEMALDKCYQSHSVHFRRLAVLLEHVKRRNTPPLPSLHSLCV